MKYLDIIQPQQLVSDFERDLGLEIEPRLKNIIITLLSTRKDDVWRRVK
jgi:hypothetical protein